MFLTLLIDINFIFFVEKLQAVDRYVQQCDLAEHWLLGHAGVLEPAWQLILVVDVDATTHTGDLSQPHRAVDTVRVATAVER